MVFKNLKVKKVNNYKIISEYINGMWMGNKEKFLKLATTKLANYESGRYILTAYNGTACAEKNKMTGVVTFDGPSTKPVKPKPIKVKSTKAKQVKAKTANRSKRNTKKR